MLLPIFAAAWLGYGWQGLTAAGAVLSTLAIAWTAYETAELRRIGIEQREIELRPVLVVAEGSGETIVLRNVGRGVALDVRVLDVSATPRVEFAMQGLTVPLSTVILNRRTPATIAAGEQASLSGNVTYSVRLDDFNRGRLHVLGSGGFGDIARQGEETRMVISCLDVAARRHLAIHKAGDGAWHLDRLESPDT